jgi:Flp pilus assembly pilin Flp
MAVVKTLLLDESGQGMTEYAILIGTLALGAIVTLLAIGTRLKNVFSNVQTQLNSVPTS